MSKHDIKLHNAAVLPFADRISKVCGINNAYLYYKNNRVEILEDKKAYEKPKEPFHKKMLREEEEERERARLLQMELDEPENDSMMSRFNKKKTHDIKKELVHSDTDLVVGSRNFTRPGTQTSSNRKSNAFITNNGGNSNNLVNRKKQLLAHEK